MKVVKWISWAEAQDAPDCGIGGLGGWFSHGHRWKDYIENFTTDGVPYVEALRQSILYLDIRYNGHDHQNQPDGVPVFETGEVATYSYRAWGDLIAAVWSTEENTDYSYMDFYC